MYTYAYIGGGGGGGGGVVNYFFSIQILKYLQDRSIKNDT